MLGLGLAATLPAGARMRPAAAKPSTDTWMHAGNAARTGVFPGPGLDLTKDIIELWRIDGRQSGYFVDPCGVCDGMTYYLPVPDGISPEVRPLVAVDARTGSELWRQIPPITEPTTYFAGQPAIADGLLIMPTWGGLLIGLDARSGESRWIFDVQGQLADSRPAIVDGVAYVSDNASVNAIAVGDTAEWLWKAPLGDGTNTVVSPIVSVDGDYVVVSSVSLDPKAEPEGKTTVIHVLSAQDGSELYRFSFRPYGQSYQLAISNGNLYSQDHLDEDNGRAFYFSMTIDGSERWTSRKQPTIEAYPAVRGDFAYATTGESVFAFDTATGEMVWYEPQPQPVYPVTVLIDDVIYAGAAPPTPMIYAVDPSDGSPLASIPLPFDGGARVVGATGGILIVRSGVNLVALANRS